jgi:hypothetical protein
MTFVEKNINDILQNVSLKTGPLEWRNQERILFRLVFGRLFCTLFTEDVGMRSF